MVAHFDAHLSQELENDLVHLLNRFLDENIVVYSLKRVRADAHARFDALHAPINIIWGLKRPFKQNMHYVISHAVDVDKMNAAAQVLMEYKDFEAFAKSHSDVKTFYVISRLLIGKA